STSAYVNSWWEMLVYICPGDSVVTGIDSYNDEGAEDRRFKFRCCGIAILLLLYISACIKAVYVNEFDQQALFHCETGEYIEEIESENDNEKEDRRWSFQCGGDGATSACTWSSYVNSWEEMLVYICPGDTVVTGIDSYHDNGSEDRRFKFRSCGIASESLLVKLV
ncbi:unnamed protein product, partial [Lymnaea stagnalis]